MNTARVDAGRHPAWFSSSYSNGAGGECVQCAPTGDKMLVRDSKLEAGPVITLGGEAWRAFTGGVVGTDV
ncbi:DUF397 domain-containing protein [Streptomyces sp. NPDC057253]|uniref:DUF397 domain-containing protein n=1 Tax=Streptomyces sp. NPDC057253 TaxID=3346069 RepID=UPI00362F3FC2